MNRNIILGILKFTWWTLLIIPIFAIATSCFLELSGIIILTVIISAIILYTFLYNFQDFSSFLNSAPENETREIEIENLQYQSKLLSENSVNSSNINILQNTTLERRLLI